MPRVISCLTNCYGRFGAPAAIASVRSAGIGYVELAIKTQGVPSIFGETPVLTDQSGERELDEVRRLLDEHSVMLSSCNITSGNPLEQATVEITKRKLDHAAALGVRLVVAGAGAAESDHDRDVLFEHLRHIGDYAGEREITYCFETHPGLCQNAAGMLTTMERLQHPHLKLNFDTGNILYYNESADVLSELKRVFSDVRHLHLKDHTGCPGEWSFTEFGSGGGVDFTAVREVLDQCGYEGPCSLEIEGRQGEPELTCEQTHQRVVASMAHLSRCGWMASKSSPSSKA
ncbi:MAG: sugar phosphate isomerase/epimerase [Planctomycetaceae bacterium]|nr:sugar phosphate isomerase/epimerase [Planctomycetaceae bacterium]